VGRSEGRSTTASGASSADRRGDGQQRARRPVGPFAGQLTPQTRGLFHGVAHQRAAALHFLLERRRPGGPPRAGAPRWRRRHRRPRTRRGLGRGRDARQLLAQGVQLVLGARQRSVAGRERTLHLFGVVFGRLQLLAQLGEIFDVVARGLAPPVVVVLVVLVVPVVIAGVQPVVFAGEGADARAEASGLHHQVARQAIALGPHHGDETCQWRRVREQTSVHGGALHLAGAQLGHGVAHEAGLTEPAARTEHVTHAVLHELRLEPAVGVGHQDQEAVAHQPLETLEGLTQVPEDPQLGHHRHVVGIARGPIGKGPNQQLAARVVAFVRVVEDGVFARVQHDHALGALRESGRAAAARVTHPEDTLAISRVVYQRRKEEVAVGRSIRSGHGRSIRSSR
jgi:hypothetical protein